MNIARSIAVILDGSGGGGPGLPGVDNLLLESSDNLLLESGDLLILE